MVGKRTGRNIPDMRSLLYIGFGIVLWYLARAAIRHYLSQPNGSGNSIPGNRESSGTGSPPQNIPYDNARDARYRDLD